MSQRALDEIIGADDMKLLIEKLRDLALSGDLSALALILSRMWVPPKTRPVSLPDLPDLKSAGSIVQALDRIMSAVAEGVLTPEEGEGLARVASSGLRALEVEQIDRRLAAVERQIQRAKS